jgi:hypothetical protein
MRTTGFALQVPTEGNQKKKYVLQAQARTQ